MEVIEQITGTHAQARQRESHWILVLKEEGIPLLNVAVVQAEHTEKITLYLSLRQLYKLDEMIVE